MKATVYCRRLSVGVNHEKPILSQQHAQARFRGEKPTGGVYPAATIKRGCARIAAGTNEVWFDGLVGVEPTARFATVGGPLANMPIMAYHRVR